MGCRLAFVDPSFREFYALKPGIMCRFEGSADAAQRSYAPSAFTLPAHYNAKFSASATTGG
jgi:hypothetical protein